MSKAASTSIQNITNTHQDFYYFGKHAKIDSKSNNRYSSAESAYLTRSIINLEKFTGFEKSSIKKINQEINQAKKNKKIFFFSNEQFCESTCPMYQAMLIKQVFKTPKILIVIRNQVEALLSHYRFAGHFLKFAPNPYKRKIIKFDDYFTNLLENFNNNGGHKARDWVSDYLRILDLDKFIKQNEIIFGKKNIIIVPFELFVKDNNILLSSISSNTGFKFSENFKNSLSINSSKHLTSSNLKLVYYFSKMPFKNYFRKINKLLNLNLFQRFSKGSSLQLNNNQLEQVNKIYSKGNKRISRDYKIDLKSLGYPI